MTTRAKAGAGRTIGTGYVPLFDVAFSHGYYNDRGGACPDFAVAPTTGCATLMESLGLLFKDQGTGFVVLADAARIPALIAWLKTNTRASGPGKGCWAWLSFQLVSNNTNFVGITNLPITTNTLDSNLHVANLATASASGTLTFGAGVPTGAEAFFPLTGAALSIDVPAGSTVSLCDLSGAAVISATAQGGGGVALDLTSLAAGFYSVARADAAGKPFAAPKGAPAGYVYLAGQPGSFGLVDLLLAQPGKGIGATAAFPVDVAKGTIRPVSLTLAFAPRDTFWRYYIVSPSTRGKLSSDLAIEGQGASFTRSSEALPNGDEAVVFAAGTALPLQRISPYHFKLSGQRHAPSGGRDSVQVARLPAAAAAPVWPAASGDVLSGSSEIYVYV
ncbi:hypothetical protein U1839_24160 [Sphingomonas sp. RT2P30]|uniref:hypothetical protein n=1 Tax=Parasphingomonas halimpatiens TaxID=3096162 RepID=UPI002FC6973D